AEQSQRLRAEGLQKALASLDPRSRRIVETRWLKEKDTATLHDLAAEYKVAAGLAGATAARAQWSVDLQKCADGGFMGFDLAIDYCTRAIKSGTLSERSLANAYYNRAVSWERKRRFDRAIADLDEAIRLQAIRPEESSVRAGAYAARGGSKFARQDYNGALADLDEALRLDPGRAEINVRRGQVWLAKGDPDKALQDFGAALRGSM